MDPWLSVASDESVIKSDKGLTFEDEDSQTNEAWPPPSNNRLPDSAAYLAHLEKKLSLLKNGGDSSKSLVKSLTAIREESLSRLLADTDSIPREVGENVSTNRTQELILRRLAPHKQAITLEEIVELLSADQLAAHTEEAEESEHHSN